MRCGECGFTMGSTTGCICNKTVAERRIADSWLDTGLYESRMKASPMNTGISFASVAIIPLDGDSAELAQKSVGKG